MADEAMYDDMFVTFRGRTMLRMAGGETVQPEESEATAEDTPTGADGESESQPTEAGTPAEEQETVDWEKRYKDLESTYTRTSMEAAQLREAQQAQEAESSFVEALSNPEQSQAAYASLVEQLGKDGAKEWAEAHGFEVADDESDPNEVRDPRVDQILAKQQEDADNARVQEIEQGMVKTLDEQIEAKGLKPDALTPELRELLLDAAAVRRGDDGLPDVKGVFTEWAQANDAVIKNYRAKKRDTPAPPAAGSSGTPNPSLSGKEERLALANAVAEEVFQSQ